jgi:predicted RNA-binding protein YlqC (UPF0109 family)
MSTIQETLEYILKAIVSDSSSIKIDDRQEGEVLVLEITAAPEIIGQIIGKEGKIIKSIRTILNLSFPDLRYSLDVKG